MSFYDPSPYRPGTTGWSGQIGRIAVINTTDHPISVTLYHPDNPSVAFGTYTINSGGNNFIANGGVIGMDWGIQVDNSAVRIVGLVSDWNVFEGTNIFQTWPKKILTNARQKFKELESAFKEVGDYVAFSYDAPNKSIGVRIGKPILENEIKKVIPDPKVFRETHFNYEEAKWFNYPGIDANKRQLLINFRVRKKHWEDIITRVLIYDIAADVQAGINLEVENREIKSHPYINNIEGDFPGGIAGPFISVYDLMSGSMMWLGTGNFLTITEVILSLSATAFNIGIATDNIKLNFIEKNLGKINIWNQSHVIFMDRIEYDSKGVWIFFKIDPDRLNAQLDDWIDELVDWVHGFTW